MSTKVSLAHGDGYHVYNECFDDENIYLRLRDVHEFCVEGITEGGATVTVSVPVKVWQEMIRAYWPATLDSLEGENEEDAVQER